MNELWCPVVGYESTYEVSNCGQVRRSTGGQGCRAGRIMKPIVDQFGYIRVRLHQDGVGKMFRIHRLVALAFVGNPGNYPEINHKDGIKSNNTSSNLEWCNRSHNVQHAFDTGLKKPSRGNVRVSEEQVLEIRKLYREGHAQRSLARKFGIGKTTVAHIVNYDYWRHLP